MNGGKVLTMEPGLRARNVTVEFSGLRALDGVSLDVDPGEVVAIIGPNGAGKTTLINVFTGLVQPTSGDTYLVDQRITDLLAYMVRRRGVARTYQHAELVGELTVLENVLVGSVHGRTAMSFLGEAWRTGTTGRSLGGGLVDSAMRVLAELGIDGYAGSTANDLPFGIQKLTDLGRAIVAPAQFVMLDEPTAGLAETQFSSVRNLVARLSSEGVGLVVVAHHLGFVEDVADRVVCLAGGSVLAEGTTQEVKTDPRVIEAYLGMG